MWRKALICIIATTTTGTVSAECQRERMEVQVLGAGGPELGDGFASSSYLIWLDDKARVMVDAGGGSSLNFEKSGARIEDLDAVLFTHLHVDHSADWPVHVKAAFFTDRNRDLPVFGPEGNSLLPAMTDFQQALFGDAWPYLSEYIESEQISEFKLPATTVSAPDHPWQQRLERLKLAALNVNHGPLPAVAWRVELGGCVIAFSGDTSARSENLTRIAKDADLLVAHNAIPEQTRGVARRLHMPPSRIGEVANDARVKKLVLSHRMLRTLGAEEETLSFIRRHYQGPVAFAEDLDRFDP